MAPLGAVNPRSHNEYTVGWVCALPKEQTAAAAMLDERHPDLPKPSNDANTYILGSIGQHNIVIACLPKGKMGANPASTVATRMIGTFQSIKVGLMVGIGGGVPPKVRVGDIVVSTPTGQYPGVVQWDLGKAEKDGVFKRTGALNHPPTALLTALSRLETHQEMHGITIPQFMEELKENWPRLAEKYTWNESRKDPLITKVHTKNTLTTKIHTKDSQGGILSVLSVLLNAMLSAVGFLFGWPVNTPAKSYKPKTKAIVESKDKRKPGEPRVHYGLIASGNHAIKDAEYRDSLNETLGGNTLCFEMEAAGLMSDFPCIVIRGIYDYADSQANEDWQEYAAAVAAAFAKEFLEHVQPGEVDKERPVKEIMK
ncbi:hypothetical protein H072_4149 [Dactylellina haptotyla CBS 200.50]|uniref:Nucleoside phosphorylase domain-containing protein n=1 Tax=Dactylellina haptotyla (strain CBS 200.50) TaxID=1284197 RepID=S8BR32_DACHA|nr:hypothetical protein H072_4149 [Dactylellina haptotyla CBS 200.50]